MNRLIVILFIALLAHFSRADEVKKLVIDGVYQQKNLYVQNYYSGSVGFCTIEVKVNGNITTDEINSSAFEIDLSALNLKYGDKVFIEIYHKKDCLPKILNIEDVRPMPTFVILAAHGTSDGLITWITEDENGALPYIIEQFKWNKWIPVGEVIGKGTPERHTYTFKAFLTSGENKFRIKQVGFNNTVRYSNEIIIKSTKNKPTFVINKDKTEIQFSEETMFEIYDIYGNIIKRGFGINVAINNIPKGVYYLCYDREVAEFKK
ncbi:MAG: hypothetical protein D6799_07325 [Bacteroidetes bacterium]|jgi:hypothetical protein|nr:MAG: hypothetical protein D6799_07325 [Bacteroidota bacterium]